MQCTALLATVLHLITVLWSLPTNSLLTWKIWPLNKPLLNHPELFTKGQVQQAYLISLGST